MKNIIIIVIVIAAIWLISTNLNVVEEDTKVDNQIEEPIKEPSQDEDDNIFVENIGNELEKNDLIRIDSPSPNERITSPLTITGEARGYWFFEGDFPVVLIGSQGGNILVESYATTESDWMTEEFVPFSATIEFDDTDNDFGMLILEKDNPSELPENADSLIVPIKF